MAVPRNMMAHMLNALKGWPAPHAVDFEAKIAQAVYDATGAPLSGTVMSLNSSGELILGVGTDNVMPLFLISNGDDPGVLNEHPDPDTEAHGWVPITPTGVAVTLPACGAYELTSTEYVTASAASLIPNALLTADKTGGDAGLLDVGTLGTHLICGVVSRGVVNNGYGFNAVAFWPVMFPVYP